jgi:trehalose 6-phosphate phosphatase
MGSLPARTRWVPERGFAPILTELTSAVGASARLLVLLDYDGTLTPIANDPRDAWLPREVQALLGRLIRYPRVHVGVISGRALGDLRERVGLTGVIRAGCHGLEIEADGLAFVHPLATAYQEAVRTAEEALRLHAGSIPGIQIESKGLTVALHWRNRESPRSGSAITSLREGRSNTW